MKVRRIDPGTEDARHYVIDLGNAIAEANVRQVVDRQTGGRFIINCSTQCGCPIGCRFCGSGESFVRSFTTAEILLQLRPLLYDRDWFDGADCELRFAAMGEPLLNLRSVLEAARWLHQNYPRMRFLLSSSAPRVAYEHVRALGVEIETLDLQFSVHATDDGARDALIPFRAKLTLAGIAAEGLRWLAVVGRRPRLNYCAHVGNSGEADAARLRELFDPAVWDARVSMVCERDEGVGDDIEAAATIAGAFTQRLREHGFDCIDESVPAHARVGGGCGQLWSAQAWMREDPGLVRPSIGCGLPRFGAPTR